MSGPSAGAHAAFAAALLAGAGFVGWQAAGIAGEGGWSGIGPRAFPAAVAIGLAIAASALLARALRAAPPRAGRGGERSTVPAAHHAAAWWLSAAMLAGAALIERAGFALAMTLAFWLATRAFAERPGSRALRDLLIAAAVALAVRLAFVQGLGLRLPAGPWGL